MIWRQIKRVQEKKAFHKVVNRARGMSSVQWPSSLKVRELQEVQAIKESEIELRLHEESASVSAERECLRLRRQLTQAKIDAERAELEAT